MKPILIAHRSGPTIYPEQTIASARHAFACNADMVEMDVQITKDGTPVICHDANAARVFGVDCPICEMTTQEFLALRQVQDCSYPSHSLDDVLRADVTPLLLHQKLSGTPLRTIMQHILDLGKEDSVVIGVQLPEDTAIVKELSPRTGVLAFMPKVQYFEDFLKTETEYIRLWEDWVSQERIDRIHETGHKVWIMAGKATPEGVGYTTEENMRAWVKMGVDGILVNDIVWADNILKTC